MIPSPPDDTLLKACRVLFGPGPILSTEFFRYIQLSGIKSAFRQRAKETHPDTYHNSGSYGPGHDSLTFGQVQESYETLKQYITEREKDLVHPATVSSMKRSFQARDNIRQHPSGAPRSADWQHSRPEPAEVRPEAFAQLPRRRLKLGHFLYFSGIVGWQDVIRALVWQKASRPRLGELGQRLGLLKKGDILAIFRATAVGHRFGEGAVRLGLLNDDQVRQLIFYQKCRQQKIGQFFIEEEILALHELQEQVKRCNRHNAHFHTFFGNCKI